MPELDAFHLASLFAAAAAVLVAEAAYLLFASARRERAAINRRLKLQAGDGDRERVLVALRRERGLSAAGHLATPVEALNRLVVQSGTTLGPARIATLSLIAGIVVAVAVGVARASPLEAIAAGLIAGAGGPILVLKRLRARRVKAFAHQFPEAIELIVRSLRAGHPVPVAIGMVAREMPDPIGTEFGIVSDEITFGSGLVSAVQNLQQRIGQEDLPLFVTAVAIQNKTGGNLREILSGLSDVIRQRMKMRRKIRAISAEGRIAALMLSALPVMFLIIINVLSPQFYGGVLHEPLTHLGLAAAAVWLAIGNVAIMRMVNFRF